MGRGGKGKVLCFAVISLRSSTDQHDAHMRSVGLNSFCLVASQILAVENTDCLVFRC